MVTPLYIFSLPRSGSTLLQRILASSNKISSVAEPWLLLPFIYAQRSSGINTEYSQYLANLALNNFIKELPNGKQDYLAAVGEAVLTLYQKASREEAQYFLDKTPRYALIANDIISMFPEGKFIYLWRNPLAIISSMMETWGNGNWNIYRYKVDLYVGMTLLLDSFRANQKQVLAIQYEALLQCPEVELARIAEYLEIDLDNALLYEFSKTLFKGTMGDIAGTERYDDINQVSLEKWQSTINNPFRKWWCRRYLKWLGEERLKAMGYDLKTVLLELELAESTWNHLVMDIVRFIYGYFYCVFQPGLLNRLRGLPEWRLVVRHD